MTKLSEVDIQLNRYRPERQQTLELLILQQGTGCIVCAKAEIGPSSQRHFMLQL